MKKIVLLIVLINTFLFAHPHFFIDSSINIDKEKITHTWIFDKLNSRLLIFDFDKDKNKNFDSEESKEFLDTHFFTIKDDNYNLFIDNGGEELKVQPKDIDVKVINKRVVINFTTYLQIDSSLTLCSIDPTLYMAFVLKDVSSKLDLNIQKSDYDFCIGVEL